MSPATSHHWVLSGSLTVPLFAAMGVLLAVVLGFRRIRKDPELKTSGPAKVQFPRKRAFLVEKSSVHGCAHPCATGPLFQFDTQETHESLESLDSAPLYKSSDAMNGADRVALFVPEYEYSFEEQGVPRSNMFAPPEDPALFAWRRNLEEQALVQEHHQQPQYFAPFEPEPFPLAANGVMMHPYNFGADGVDDDSDSGASLPSHTVESLVSTMNIMPVDAVQNGFQLHDDESLPLDPLSNNVDLDDIIMPFDKPMDPLDSSYELRPARSLLSEGLRGMPSDQHQHDLHDQHHAHAHQHAHQHHHQDAHLSPEYAIDPNHLSFEQHIQPSASNSQYSVSKLSDTEKEFGESIGFAHLNSPGSEHYSPSHLGLSDGSEHLAGSISGSMRRKLPSSMSSGVTKDRSSGRKKAYLLSEGRDAEFPVLAASTPSFHSDSLGGSASPGHLSPAGEFEHHHSTEEYSPMSSTLSKSPKLPKSPKESDFVVIGEDGTARYRCPHCDTTFRIRGYLTRHIKKHADVMMYNCPFYNPDDEHRCHATGGFSRRDTYKTHLKARHFHYPRGTGRKDRFRMPGTCSGCGEEFSNNEEWVETHIQTGKCQGNISHPFSGSLEGDKPSDKPDDLLRPSASPMSDSGTDLADSYLPFDDFRRGSVLVSHVQ